MFAPLSKIVQLADEMVYLIGGLPNRTPNHPIPDVYKIKATKRGVI